MSDAGNRVSGPVAGQFVQAGSVHGDVHFHAHDSRPPVPRQLLLPPPGFTGRDNELEFLEAQLDNPGVIVLKGQGGVGKTALALHWLGAVSDRFPDGQLYADLTLSTAEPVAPEDILGQFLRSLGVPPSQVPDGFPERTALYRTLTTDKKLAVLLDDAVSAAQVRALLPASARAITIVTSRRSLLGLLASGAQTLPVRPLDRAGALMLLASRVGREKLEAERDSAEDLVDLCGGLPIALCVAGARAAARPHRGLGRLVDELRDECGRLDALTTEDDLSVRSTLDLAFADLPQDLREIYLALGLLPDGPFEPEVVSAMTKREPAEAGRALEALVDASLADEVEQDNYRVHELVRLHALDRAADLPERAEMVQRAMEWFLYTAQAADRLVMPARSVVDYRFADPLTLPREVDDRRGALAWLVRSRPSLLTLTRDALNRNWPSLAYRLADVLQPLLILHKHRADAVNVAEFGLRAAQALGDVKAIVRMRKILARVHINQGDPAYAEYHAAELLKDAKARGDRRDEAGALKTLALLESSRGEHAKAAEALDRTTDLLRGLGNRRGEALALINLAEERVGLEEVDRAQVALERALELLGALPAPDPYNEARAVAVLGHSHLVRQQENLARPLLEQALATFVEQDSGYERARVHRLLAQAARATGDALQAQRHEELAETLFLTTAD